MAGAADVLTISTEPPASIAQNFARLLEIGVGAAQRLSSDLWTDFNEHDPGVTILEALTYALTDVSYRIGHPIEDLLASSMSECGTPLEDQPLFTGDRILTSAPYSERDFRKLAYDKIRGLRDLWILPVSNEHPGIHQVYVQRFNASADDLPDPDPDEILGKVNDILNANRPFGEDFLYPKLICRRELKLKAIISISAEATPEVVLARILFRIGRKLNPPPELREVEKDLMGGTQPDQIYNGPRLEMGWIPDRSLPQFAARISDETIADTILTTDQVTGLHSFDVSYDYPDGEPPDGLAQTVLSTQAPNDDELIIRRDGVNQSYNGAQVIAYISHKEESARWATSYASNRTEALKYSQVPLGRSDRNLGRYRSVQHLFPAVYRLGQEDNSPDEKPTAVDLSESPGQRGVGDDPQAARMQLKAYLLFFEQLLADSLSQLSHTANLFSFSAGQERTYFPQPLVPQNGESPDAPPDIDRVLGAGDDEQGWWMRYARRLGELSAGSDPVPERLNAMRSALLARFGAQMPDERLRHLQSNVDRSSGGFIANLAEQKREYLANIVDIEKNRALGLNPLTGKTPPATGLAIQTLTGHQGICEIIDHVLLHPLACDHQNEARRGPCFAAVLSERDCHGKDRKLHIIPAGESDVSEMSLENLCDRFSELAQTPKNLEISPSGGYCSHVRILNGSLTEFYVIEDFLTWQDASNATKWLSDAAGRLRDRDDASSIRMSQVELPLDFYGRRMSVILGRECDAEKNDEYESFVASTLDERLPAHLRHQAFWMDHSDALAMRAELAEWRSQLSACRKNRSPSRGCSEKLDEYSRQLRQHIARLSLGRMQDLKAMSFRSPKS